MIADEALRLICEFEGFHKLMPGDMAAPYLCPAGVATTGYGSIWRMDGSHVEMTDAPITRDEAMTLMAHELARKCLPSVRRAIHVPLDPLMHGALVSFAYNLGGGALRSSTLRRKINASDWDDVPGEFAKWRMAGGRVLSGLVRRRAAETQMFMAGLDRQRQLQDVAGPSNDNSWLATIQRAA